jgi:hypothetical protein
MIMFALQLAVHSASLVGLAAPAPDPGGGPAASCAARRLTLEMRETLPLPPTMGIDGVAPLAGGKLLLWTADGALYRIGAGHPPSASLLPDGSPLAGATVNADGDAMVVDHSGRVFRMGSDDQAELRDSLALGPGAVVDRALAIDGGWAVAVRDLRRHIGLVVLVDRAGRREVIRTAPEDSLERIPRFALSAAGDGLYAARTTAPYTIYLVSLASGSATVFSQPLAAGAVPLPPDSLPLWRALAAVPLDCGVLQTFASLTSDARWLVRYDPAGRVVQARALLAPFGLVAAAPGGQGILAARRAGGLELVRYDWRWSDSPAPYPAMEALQ